MSSPYDYGYEHGRPQSIWYYAVFPLDAWARQQDPAFTEQKRSEVWPIMMALLPLIVLAAGFMLQLGFFGNLFFFGIEALLLALVGKFYLKLKDFGQTLELFLNFWVAFLLMSLIMLMIVLLVSLFL